MPHLRVRGMKEEEIVTISTELLDEIIGVLKVPRDHFTIEYIPSTFVFDGEINKNRRPFIEVLCFVRGEKAMTQIANIITQFVKPFGYKDVAVCFIDLKKEHYYENGAHL